MKKVHVLFPLIAMILFGGYWWNYNKQYEAEQEAKKERDRQALVAKREKEAQDRELAIKLAIEKQAEQRREREIREAKRQKEREDRQTAREARERLLAEEGFLQEYVRKAESNEGGITEVIQRIAAAEAARAAAAAEAAQASSRRNS